MRPGQGVAEGLHQLPPADLETHVWISASIPGDVYTDLWKAGAIDDPYYGRNSMKAQWVMYDEWWYALQFNVSEDVGDRLVRLEFDGVDFSCEVWLNGHHLGRHEGAFSRFAFDVTDVLNTARDWQKGRNLLMVRLDPPPQVNHRVVGLKTPWFGDYWRDLVPFGIWRPVRLVATGRLRIDDVYLKSELHDDGSATVHAEVTVENHTDTPAAVTVPIRLTGKNCDAEPAETKITATVQPGKTVLKTTIDVPHPQLWWPWDLGKPNLYRAHVRLLREDGRESDHHTTTFGIREIRMAWNPGFTRDEVSFPRTVFINGKRHFIRSACWGGPPDIFVGRTSPAEYRRLIEMARAANMNNIRIFGWHPPEIPEFYEYCNELGLTVWQDVIPLGTANISQDPAFLERIYAEAVAVIRERRNHPSLILIEGGEEAFLRADDPAFTNAFLLELGRRLHEHCDLPYVPDSPLTDANARSVGYKPKEAVHALAYFYSMGRWLMEDWYSELDYPIVPELAITSVPSVESLRKFIPPGELWPPGPSWGHHWADLDRLRMQNFDAFGDKRTGSLEEFVNATQDAQGIIFQLAIEHFRRRKPRTSGIALCHYITYWPDMKWGIVDAYQQPKRSYEYVRRAYQPLLVNLQFDRRRWRADETFAARLWVVNDFYRQFTDTRAVIEFRDETGAVLDTREIPVGDIPGDSSASYAEVDWDIARRVVDHFDIRVRLLAPDGTELSANTYRLLIGDQAAAAAKMKRMGEALRARLREFDYGNYYRFFPKITAENPDEAWQSANEIPRARGF